MNKRIKAAYARRLMRRQYTSRLGRRQRAWLENWRKHHPNPDRDEYCVGRNKDNDLGVGMTGLEVVGAKYIDELGHGNVNIAGGWYWRIVGLEDDNGWPAGYEAQLDGLDAFLEAMALEPIEDASKVLGPFHDPTYPQGDQFSAQRALLKRLLATLVIVSEAALERNPEATPRIAEQTRQFDRHLDDVIAEHQRPAGDVFASD